MKSAAAPDIYEQFGVVLDVGGLFSDAGSAAYPSAESGFQTQALGRIDWESQDYRHGDCKGENTNTFKATQ
ncbi:MAG: hypothetical protein NVS1B11_10130 [Terriglobales bacterium]